MNVAYFENFRIRTGITKRKKNFMNNWEIVKIGTGLEEYKELENFVRRNKTGLLRFPICYKRRVEDFFLNHVILYSKEFKDKEEQIRKLFIDSYIFPQIIELFSSEFFSEDKRLIINGKDPYKTSLYPRGEYMLKQIDEIRNLRNILEYYVKISEKNYKESVV